jgi:MFS family permease
MLLMTLGTFCFLIGYTLFGFIHGYIFFVAVMLLITYGEMIIIPVGQTLVAQFAPEKVRGRYMGVYNLSWSLPSMAGPYLGGLIMDNYNPDLLWYICGVVSIFAVAGFLVLYFLLKE